MSKEKTKKSRGSSSIENVWYLLSMLLVLSLGALIGREIHRYEVQHVDDNRINQLIEALEKKPVELKVYPLVPFRVPPRPDDKITDTLDYSKENLCHLPCPRGSFRRS